MSQLRKILTDFYRVGTGPLRSMRMHQFSATEQVPVFVLFYHRIADKHPNPWSMEYAMFRDQILWMKKRFDMVSLEEVQHRIANGKSARPAVSISFDDGYAENCDKALPFLLENKVPVTYFVTTDHTTNQKPFPHDVEEGIPLPANTLESLRALANAGVEIGAHTRTHPDLGSLTDPDEMFDEVITATREMEVHIGRKIRYFAFPFGQHSNLNVEVFELLKQAGFKGVCSAYGGWNEVGGDPFHIQRIHGDPDFSRMKNWLTYDPRIANTERYDYRSPEKTVDWAQWLDEPSEKSRFNAQGQPVAAANSSTDQN